MIILSITHEGFHMWCYQLARGMSHAAGTLTAAQNLPPETGDGKLPMRAQIANAIQLDFN
jgi:hypothetical protein